jgi:thioredoxin reductase (NADPH)
MAGVRLAGPENRPELNEQTMETNVAGVYAAGTAVAGTQQRYRLFVENCHVHVGRILAALTGQPAPSGAPAPAQLEA